MDREHNVLVAGEIWGRIRFDEIELDSHFDHDGFLAKYSPNGDVVWARQLSSLSVAIPRSLAVDPVGDVIMAGYFDQSCDIDHATLIARGAQDVFLAKFNAIGGVIWAVNLGGPRNENPRHLAVDSANNIYVTGSFEQTVDFGGVKLTTGGQRDVFIAACNPSG